MRQRLSVHTNTGKHHIPESTFNYQKALIKYVQGDVFIARDYIVCTMANKRYTYVLRISILLLKRFFYKALPTDYLGFGMKPKVRALAAELNAEPELFQFKANITYLIKFKAQKYHILREQHKILGK